MLLPSMEFVYLLKMQSCHCMNIYYCSNGCGALDEAPVGRPRGVQGVHQTNYHVCTINARQVAASPGRDQREASVVLCRGAESSASAVQSI